MSEEHLTHDPGAPPEDEGIPDLQDESPEGEPASDPQRESVPVDEPVAVNRFGTTFSEQVEGESLDERLSEEEPEVSDAQAEGPGAEPVGQLTDEPLQWRAANQDLFSEGSGAHGLSGEESAVYVSEDNDSDLGLGLESLEEAASGADRRPEPAEVPPAVDQDPGADVDLSAGGGEGEHAEDDLDGALDADAAEAAERPDEDEEF